MSDKKMTWEEAVLWLKEDPEREAFVRACYYDDPIEAAAARYSTSEEWLAVAQLLHTHLPGKVLDMGAGRGISSYAFAQIGCQVTALEPDPSDLVGAGAIKALVDTSGVPINIVQSYGETLPFRDMSFDVVYGRAVLHHARDINRFCEEAARVLRPGGIFVVTREHVISKHEDREAFFSAHALHDLYGGENAFLLNEYIAAITGANLKLTRTIGPSASVINYAPITTHSFRERGRQTLSRFIGPLAYLSPIQRVYPLCRDWISNVPGRHYSFVGLKA